MKLGERVALALAVVLGLCLAVLRSDGVLLKDHSYYSFKHNAQPSLYQADQAMLKADNSGYYMFAPRLLGRLARPLARADLQESALSLVQIALWVVQLYFCFLIARTISGEPWAALLATLLVAWGTPLMKVIDAPTEPSTSIGRSLGYALVMPSVYFYFSGRKWAAWLAAALALYLHGNPAVHLLMLYALEDAWQALSSRESLPALLGRLAAVAVILAPIAWYEHGAHPIPDRYFIGAYIGLIVYPPIPDYYWTDWSLFFQGMLFIALAWRESRDLPESKRISRIFLYSGFLIFMSWFSRAVMIPYKLPLGTLVMKVTSCFSYLFLAELLGLMMLARFVARGFQNGRDSFSLYLLLAALLASHYYDYALRFVGLGLIAGFAFSRRAGGICALPWIMGMALIFWHWKADVLIEIWKTTFHLGGGIFQLPAFQRVTVAAWIIAGLLSFFARGSRAKWALPGAVAFIFLGAIALLPAPSRAYPVAWQETKQWVRANTPVESFVMIPPSEGGALFTFMIDAERPVFTPTTEYAMMLCEDGVVALTVARRLEDVGYDYACCRTATESRVALETAYGALGLDGMRMLINKYGLTHAIVRDTDPFNKKFAPIYENAPYKVYSLNSL